MFVALLNFGSLINKDITCVGVPLGCEECITGMFKFQLRVVEVGNLRL